VKRHGTIGGIPYDTRRPTVARFKNTYWSADNPKFFPPKMNGFGWAINLYWVFRPLRWLKARRSARAGAGADAGEPETAP